MQSIATTIRNTYYSRFEEMELEYKFHFASRLYAWNSDPNAKLLLEKLKPDMLPNNHELRTQNLADIRKELGVKDYERDVNNYAARKPYFEKYPDLLLLHNALFRIRHWLCVYGVDERSTLYDVLPKEDVEQLLHAIQNDDDAVRILSTYVINTLYLYAKLYDADTFSVDLSVVRRVADSYDRSDPKDVQLLIYLYTHCVIGETLFYYQPISRQADTYTEILRELDDVVKEQHDNITLDNKFEFLVCARLCSLTSKNEQRIYDEAARSLSDEGFIVDVFNRNINPAKQTFMMSEHRNVLFLMSMTRPVFMN